MILGPVDDFKREMVGLERWWVLLAPSSVFSDDDVYYYIRWRLKLEGETENMGVCTKERKGVTAAVLMATPCTNSLGGESGGQKHEGCGGRSACWKYAAVSGSGAGGRRC